MRSGAGGDSDLQGEPGVPPRKADPLFEDAQALPSEERAILALQILDSVGEPEAEIERAWHDEVRRRLDDIDAGRARLASWNEARRRIFASR